MNSTPFLAHPDKLLSDHLSGVAELAELFAGWFGASGHGKLAGLVGAGWVRIVCLATPEKHPKNILSSERFGTVRFESERFGKRGGLQDTGCKIPPSPPGSPQSAFLRLHGYNPHVHWVFWCFYGYIQRLRIRTVTVTFGPAAGAFRASRSFLPRQGLF